MSRAEDAQALRILKTFVSAPTAPFHEERVAAQVRSFARRQGLPVTEDPHGNLLVTWKGKSGKPVWVITGHMDHPGFTILDCSTTAKPPGAKRATARSSQRASASSIQRASASAQWSGGVRPEFFQKGTPVIVYTPTGEVRGRLAGVELAPDAKRVQTLRLDLARPVSRGDFGSWDLVPYALSRGVVSSKSIDDLAGCAVATAVVALAAERRLSATVAGFFTRGEEAGMIGALGAMRDRLLPRAARFVNVEASSCLVPGVAAGAGPIVRTGDRVMTFDPGMTFLLSQTAERLAAGDKTFRFQRALMTGGGCEASAFTLWGYATGAVALPLVNYHNMGTDGRIRAEQIHERDYLGAVRLLAALVAQEPEAPGISPASLQKRFEGSFERLKGRLKNPLFSLPVPSPAPSPHGKSRRTSRA